ncbi:MAG: TetR/AcrR family transcriptional regulator C-terminal domain-containing protein [Labilithrix sp.]|nr:TetR/AcrR family transcriptional regulator C-terminal domain-containing protein [Labilithrix sp.]
MSERKPAAEDAARLMAALWRVAPAKKARGPRPSSSVDEVVDAAIAIADADGFEALTIRGVADRLGVSPMSVYTYVSTKAGLFALMVDAVNLRMDRSRPKARTWRARVTAVADDNRRLYERHPWLVTLPPNRPPLGPGTLAKYEYELGALEDVGLDDVSIDAALGFVLGFVESCAHASARARAAEQESSQSDADWWDAYGPELARAYDPSKYPLATRIGSASGEHHQGPHSSTFAYTFGLARVLDGLEALVRGAKR